MDSAPLKLFGNQVITMGLHDISNNFRPNLAASRVFSMGTKFIQIWKKQKYIRRFQNFWTSIEE